MRTFCRILTAIFCTIFILCTYEGHTQCSGGSNGGTLAPTFSYQTTTYVTPGLYKTFTAIQGATYYFTFCSNGGTASYDTEITILDNTGAFAGGYSDDFCSFLSDVTWLAPSNGVYRVLVSAYPCGSFGPSATLAYAAINLNDLCTNAITIAIPSTTTGSTTSATTDVAPTCGSASDASSGGVWYTVTGNGQKLTASLCSGTSFDSQLRVFSGACGSLVCVAGNDDGAACSGLQSEVTWCSTPATVYRILVHGFGASTGNFSLAISGQAVPTPVITVNMSNSEAPVLTSTSATSYQWFKNGTPVGTNQTLVVSAAGVYTVQVITNGCLSALSDPVPMVITGDLDNHASTLMNLFPNPGTDHITVTLGGFEKDKPVDISIIDLQGRVIGRLAGSGQHDVTIDVRNYAVGKYIARAQQNTSIVNKVFVKADK